MEAIKSILVKRETAKPKISARPLNPRWEAAKEFGEYVGIPTIMVMRLFKLYGMEKTLALRSDLADFPHSDKFGYAVNRLKGLPIQYKKQF